VRIDRKRKQSVTVLLKALGWTTEQILEEFGAWRAADTRPRAGLRAKPRGCRAVFRGAGNGALDPHRRAADTRRRAGVRAQPGGRRRSDGTASDGSTRPTDSGHPGPRRRTAPQPPSP
ncbi:hypothetical protein AB0885_43505, partial [Streptomyces sp. NPDC005534]|uniref:hypothetical protein n=1 Tax=Streptomyces sp. NPDC005534 TaxID=3155714 RepID=UPI00345356AA